MTAGRRDPAGRVVAEQRRRLLERDGPLCWLCGGVMDLTDHPDSRWAPSKDHVIPVSMGGDDSDGNARLAHRLCNSQRGNRPPADIGPQSRRWI